MVVYYTVVVRFTERRTKKTHIQQRAANRAASLGAIEIMETSANAFRFYYGSRLRLPLIVFDSFKWDI